MITEYTSDNGVNLKRPIERDIAVDMTIEQVMAQINKIAQKGEQCEQDS